MQFAVRLAFCAILWLICAYSRDSKDFEAQKSVKVRKSDIIEYGLPARLSETSKDDGDDQDKRRSVGVCITGSLDRMEVESKVRNLFLNNEKGGNAKFNLDVVLSFGDPRGEAQRDRDRLYRDKVMFANGTYNREELTEILGALVRSITFDFAWPTSDPVLNVDLLDAMARGNGTQNSYVVRAAAEEVQHMYSMRRCYDQFLNLESRGGFRYDFFLRLREDSYLLRRVNLRKIWKTVGGETPGATVSAGERITVHPACGRPSNLAHNDQAAAISRGAGAVYFRTVMDNYFMFWRELIQRGKAASKRARGKAAAHRSDDTPHVRHRYIAAGGNRGGRRVKSRKMQSMHTNTQEGQLHSHHDHDDKSGDDDGGNDEWIAAAAAGGGGGGGGSRRSLRADARLFRPNKLPFPRLVFANLDAQNVTMKMDEVLLPAVKSRRVDSSGSRDVCLVLSGSSDVHAKCIRDTIGDEVGKIVDVKSC